MGNVAFDPRSPDLINDPYPMYRSLREHEPVRWLQLEVRGAWLVTRYQDVKLVLQDLRFRKDLRYAPSIDDSEVNRSMLFSDPPDHTRLRGLVSMAFTPKMIRELEPKIAEITDELLEAASDGGTIDLVEVLAFPLPVIVIAQMLGVPESDRASFRQWTNEILDGSDSFISTDEKVRRAEEAHLALIDYLRHLIDLRRREPRDDLITRLLAAHDEQGRLSEEELLFNCRTLLIAGHETTVGLIGNGVYSLLRHPDQLARLQRDPQLIGTAIEEMLRYESPVQRGTFRFAGEAVELGGQQIAAGDEVRALIGSANRDPEQFPYPDVFDVRREPNRHLAFGRGIHFCLGAALARTETRIALLRVLERLPSLSLAGSPQWHENTMFRRLKKLPVQVGRTQRAA